jgi:two-component system chemotaxis response regulator CheB
VIGVVLTGGLDDGTVGLLQVKRSGGVAVVQDPEEALYAGMPASALRNVPVDHVVRLGEIGPLLVELTRQPVQDYTPRTDVEAQIEKTGVATMDDLNKLGSPSAFTCPDCGGALWELQDGNLLRYRCHVGHAYSPDTLLSAKTESVEAALWAALRSLEENAELARRIAKRAHGAQSPAAATFEARATATEEHAETLRQLLRGVPAAEAVE